MKITMEIQFGNLLNENYTNEEKKMFILKRKFEYAPEYFEACKIFNENKKIQIDKVISEICEKFTTDCDEYDLLASYIIESFFDVFTENPKEKMDEIYEFLTELKKKYPYSYLDWYVSEQSFDSNESQS